MKRTIEINVENLSENMAIWLSKIFREEMMQAIGASSNEHLFALGSDNEESIKQHEQHSEEQRNYALMLKDAYNQIHTFWGKNGQYITDEDFETLIN